jgi:hypothetical protein
MKTEYDIENTFWNQRRDAEVQLLMQYIPFTGECKTPAMDAWRKFQNDYYRFYNDGARPNHMRVEMYARKAGIKDYVYRGSMLKDSLEAIGDGLMEAALAEINSGVAQKAR